MTKAELIKDVAKMTGKTQEDVRKIFDATIDVLIGSFSKGEGRIAIPKLGVFKVKKRKPRIGRNPKTGKQIKIPERYIVSFSPSKTLKEIVNK